MLIASRLLSVAAAVVMVFTVAPPVFGDPEPRPGQLVTVAGVEARPGYSGDGGDARQALLGDLLDVAVAPDGVVYIADEFQEVVRAVSVDGIINTVPGVSDPEEWATRPVAVTVDGAGVLYVATVGDVRRRNPDGTFTVIAGGGDKDFYDGGDGGDGGPATEADLYGVTDLAVAPDGSVYLVDEYDGRIRRVAPDGILTTVAGGGAAGVTLDRPSRVAVDRRGNVYFVHDGFRGVQRIAPDGVVTAVLGQETSPGFAGDGGPAAKARFDRATAVATDVDGNLYVLDEGNQNIRVIDERGVIDTIGPSVPAVGIAVGPDGDLYLTGDSQVIRLVRGTVEAPPSGGKALAAGPARWADQEPGTVLRVAGSGAVMSSTQRFGNSSGPMTVGRDGTVFSTTFEGRIIATRPDGQRKLYAGSGNIDIDGDGGPATKAGIGSPDMLAADEAGNLYLADKYDGRIRKIDADGTITTIAGTENRGGTSILDEAPNGDGGPATAAVIMPEDIAAGPDGSLYVADSYGKGRIRRIDPQGTITSIAGGGNRDIDNTTSPSEVFLGYMPTSLAVDQGGNVYFTNQQRLYVLSPGGTLSPVTGEGHGFAGDGGPAGQALLNSPGGLAVGPDGTRYIADTDNNRVRAVRPDGTITTVAGNGTRKDDGDGGPATEAGLLAPNLVATDAAGNLYVTTRDADRVRRIDTKGRITTVAEFGLVVDGPAIEMVVDSPVAVDTDPTGTAYVVGTSPLMALTTDGKVHKLADIRPDDITIVSSLTAGPDGSVYLTHDERVDRIYPDGATVTVAGGGAAQYADTDSTQNVDGKLATSVVLDPGDVAIGPTGELYLTSGTRVYRLNRDGTLKSIVDLKDADGVQESNRHTMSMAVGRDGEIYLAHAESNRAFAVNRSGEVRVFAGNGSSGGGQDDRQDGDEATDAPLASPTDIAVAPDGTVYIATDEGIRRVSTDGDMDTVVEPLDGGRYGLRDEPDSLALDGHGNLYFTVEERNRVYVAVRPGELSQPFPWHTLWWGVVAVVVLAAVTFGVFRHRGARTEHHLPKPVFAGTPAELADRDEPAGKADPVEPTDSADPAEPAGKAEPAEPVERDEPTDAADPT